MEVLNDRVLDELEALKIMKDVFFDYIPEHMITMALADAAERIKNEMELNNEKN